MKKLFAILVLSMGFIGFAKYIKRKKLEYSNLILEEELPIEVLRKEVEIPKEELPSADKLPIDEVSPKEEEYKLIEPEVNTLEGTIPKHARRKFKRKDTDDRIDQLPIIQEMIRDFIGADTIEDLFQLIEYIPSAPYNSENLEDNDENLIGNTSIEKLEKLIQYLTDYERQVLVEFTIQLVEEYKEDNDYAEQNDDFN
ncbi:MAG: hypothetical protein NTY74_10445 [Ignavibacteriae bacterium]|nr:hypothetical protein [Ignavibacteriota bacterium]